MPVAQNSAFLSSDSSDNENEIANPQHFQPTHVPNLANNSPSLHSFNAGQNSNYQNFPSNGLHQQMPIVPGAASATTMYQGSDGPNAFPGAPQQFSGVPQALNFTHHSMHTGMLDARSVSPPGSFRTIHQPTVLQPSMNQHQPNNFPPSQQHVVEQIPTQYSQPGALTSFNQQMPHAFQVPSQFEGNPSQVPINPQSLPNGGPTAQNFSKAPTQSRSPQSFLQAPNTPMSQFPGNVQSSFAVPQSPQMLSFPTMAQPPMFPNGNVMALMQDPNFLNQMALLMKQLQLQQAQQSMTQPNVGLNPCPVLPNNGSAQAQAPQQLNTPPPPQPAPIQQQTKQSQQNGKSKSPKAPQPIASVPLRTPKSMKSTYSGPRKEVYILVLGETGVGKSTWINGIANYMSFDHIVDALEAPEPICVIPSMFTMCDDQYRQREIHVGKSTNEVFGKGQSATQEPKTYLFPHPKYDVYIIDTPGVGDVRGIDQDKENTRKILSAISGYKNLHAICLLFKANEARMTLGFRYCISELLLQLHKDAAKNIVFFFTNARGTLYKPGDTIVPLRAFLDEIEEKHGIQVALNRDNIFCLDNEAFKFVCAYHNGFEFSEEDMHNFESSWTKSASETNRFLDYAAGCQPHSVDKTLSVNQARGIILQLAKPLADINDLIETNIKVYNDRKVEIENTNATITDLQVKLLIPQIGIKTEELDYPMTVCTSSKCIETQSIPNSEQLQTIYKQICHDRCQLDNVDPERFPEPHLQQCWAMQGGQQCHECGCEWSTHMHIRFKQVKTNENVEDINIKNAIQTNEDAKITKQKIIDSCEQTVKGYKEEQKMIMDASIRFAVFLKQNAIMTYNDVFEKYVEKSIEEEEKCIRAGGDHTKLNNLRRCLDEYRQERAAIEHALQQGGSQQMQITTEDVKQMKSTLFALPHFGAKLKELFNRTVQGYSMNQQQSVQKFSPPPQQPSTSGEKRRGVLGKLRRIFPK